MSPDKSPLFTTEESPSSYPYSPAEATETASKTELNGQIHIPHSQDTVEAFQGGISSLSLNGKKSYDQPAQIPSLVPPLTNVQESSSVSSIQETPSLMQKRVQEQTQALLSNVESILSGQEEAINKTIEEFARSESPDDKKKVSFMRKILDTIQALKAVLQDMQLADATYERAVSQEKSNQYEQRMARLEGLIQKQQELEAERQKVFGNGEAAKWTGIVLSSLATLLSTLLSIATAGACIPLVVASVTMSLATTSFFITEAATGNDTVGKIVKAFNEGVKKLFPDSPEWVNTLIKITVVIAVVAICVAAGYAGGAAVAANSAGKSVTELAKTFIGEFTKQSAAQLIPMAILASNAIPELVATIVKETGGSQKDQQTAEFVMIIIQTIMTLLAFILPGIIKAIKEPKVNPQAPKMSEKEIWEGAASYLSNFPKWARDVGNSLFLIVMAKIHNQTLSPEKYAEIVETIQVLLQNLLLLANKGVELGNLGVQATFQVMKGVSDTKQADLLRVVGEAKAREEFILELIHLLEKIVTSLQSDIANRADFLSKISDALMKFYEEIRQTTSRLYRPIQG